MSEHRISLAPSQALVPRAAAPTPNPQASPPLVDSRLLLQGRHEVTIAHQGQHYRLRVTSLGKLILTK